MEDMYKQLWIRHTSVVSKDAIKEGEIDAMSCQLPKINSLLISLIFLPIVQNIKLSYLSACTQCCAVGLTTMIRFHILLILVWIQKLVQESTINTIGGSYVLMTMKSSTNSLGVTDQMRTIPALHIQHGTKSSEQPLQLVSQMGSKDPSSSSVNASVHVRKNEGVCLQLLNL